ncbi:phospho-sugar mutase [Texcoconibacillus texcoconensis]|uniref:Phosphoglucomutase n=1 Tax=Texcoconibacillus texcoconensis TaxID=1095777 RepID=A0A840QPL0_9BACI|nr:phospho-sugar mutase [Texcoconibacillus texcoconensis]MBB5173314.1 phosphoglucomutase [Texcoconibacillus texcoconensis]
MVWKQEYERWLDSDVLEEEQREELANLQSDETELEDRFYKSLTFGTGGMRGEIGVGTNRMNVYTVRKAAQGLADYLQSFGEDAVRKGVVIAYDNRYRSQEFAREAALTLGANGVRAYVLSSLRATPLLSFSVRHLQTSAGIMITASHNPPEYNGLKVYGEDGCQLVPKDADALISYVNRIEDELTVRTGDERELQQQGLLAYVDEEVDEAYLEHLKGITLNQSIVDESGDDLSVVYTPLHGAACQATVDALKQAGFSNLTVVEEQAKPDPSFSEVSSPNPEEHRAFDRAIEIGKEHDADILMATDPDGDRIGLAVKDGSGDYTVLTGNQTGALLMEYILQTRKEQGTLPDDGLVIKTIVTSELGQAIANKYGVTLENTLTGFKFIGERILQAHDEKQATFLFGYEESYGYLIQPFVRDKDAVQVALMAAEVALYHKRNEKTLLQALEEMYEEYGWYLEELVSFKAKGKTGQEKIENVLDSFRKGQINDFAGLIVKCIEDYQQGKRYDIQKSTTEPIELPASNVIKVRFEDGSWFCLRPSGTEPKMKAYIGVQSESLSASRSQLLNIKRTVVEKVETILEK